MKPKHLHVFCLLAAGISLLLLWMLFRAPSGQEHALLGGLSGPRLAMAGLLLAGVAGFGGLWLALLARPGWAARAALVLDRRLRQPEDLLAASAFGAAAALLIFLGALAGTLLGYGQVVRRSAEVLLWGEGLSALLLGLLWQCYASLYRQPGFFAGAARRLARAFVLDHADFWLALVLLALSGLVLFASSSISQGRPPSHDSGIFLYFGQQILRVKIPFRDLWDHKPPLVFYVDAAGLLLGRGSPWGVWALEYLALAGSSLLGFRFLRRFFGRIPAALAVTFSLGGIVFFLEGGNLTEEFSLPLQWGVLAIFALSARLGWQGRAGAARVLAAGLLFALALNFKQTMVGMWAALFVWLGLCWLWQGRRGLWKVFAWAALGAGLGQAAILLYFAAQGALAEYWRVAFVYNLVYSDIAPGQRVTALADLFDFLTHSSPLFPLAFVAWVGGVARLLITAYRHTDQRWKAGPADGPAADLLPFPLLPALIDFPIELILISTSGKNYRHYFMTLLPVMTILVGWGAAELGRQFAQQNALRWPRLRLPRWLVGTATLLLVGLILAPSVLALAGSLEPVSATTAINEVVRLVEAETRPGDTVLLWGSQAVVNYLSERPAPTRFVHQKPLFRAGFASPALSAELLRDLQAHPPALIINTHLPSTPFLTASADGGCQLPPTPPAGMEAVFQFICQNYRLERVVTKDAWEVYQLK